MKPKTTLMTALCLLSIHFTKAQTPGGPITPSGGTGGPPIIDCGMLYYYDNAGNRILRMYVPCRVVKEDKTQDSTQTANNAKGLFTDSSTLATFQIVMINPNPTAGPFNITCNQVLNNAGVTVVDLNGQVVSQSVANGTNIQMDISQLTPGVYTVTVTSNGTPTSKTLVKMSAH
jgi:hypothetical protein